jgi:hypothetical protein
MSVMIYWGEIFSVNQNKTVDLNGDKLYDIID